MSGRDVSVWLTSEVGTLHYACAPNETVGQAIIDRYVGAGVCTTGSMVACCRAETMACAFDVFHDDDHVEAIVVMAYALQRAEGREGPPPFKCLTCGVLTFGGCHPPDGEDAIDETPEGLPCVPHFRAAAGGGSK